MKSQQVVKPKIHISHILFSWPSVTLACEVHRDLDLIHSFLFSSSLEILDPADLSQLPFDLRFTSQSYSSSGDGDGEGIDLHLCCEV